MPHFGCTNKKCNHEWDGRPSDGCCGWCGSPAIVLEEETQFEKFIKDVVKEPNLFKNTSMRKS